MSQSKQLRFGGLTGAFAMVALLAACGEREVILTGERIAVRDSLDGVVGAAAPSAEARSISLPAMQSNADWGQRGQNARHAAPHAALGAAPQQLWTTKVGAGSSRKNRISAAPVVAGGRIFTMDAGSTVAATSAAGTLLWQLDLTPGFDRDGGVSGGGLAAEGGRIYATTGYGEVVALDAATGGQLWRQRVDAPVQGAPAVSDGVVYVAGRDGAAWAINAADGKVAWQLTGTPGVQGYLGTAAPTVGDRAVFFPSGAGDLMAVLKQGGGVKLWTESVAGRRLGTAYAGSFDVTGDAALLGDTLYTGTAAGRTVAIDGSSGKRLWEAGEGALGPLAFAGGSLFLVNDQAELVRLQASNGAEVWKVAMPYFEAEKPRKHKAIYAHFGPVLAGGRLWVASSDGLLRGFSATDGSLVQQVEIPGGAATQPAVAGGVLYVVTNSGQLMAFR